MTINGFEIDQFNVYKLEEGKKYHTCPLCSHTRKKKTQKCLTARWEVGLGQCSHCGELIQLHTYKKKDKSKDYTVPEKINNTQISDKALKWFEKRGISQFIVRLMKISEGKELMPDKKSENWIKKNTIQFNYFRHTEIVNIKYRSGDKSFKLYKGAEKLPYNVDRAMGQEMIYCVEGEIDVLTVMECGIHNVISPPNGFTEKGNINLDWINNDVEHFINAEKIILVFDNDIPGENGKKEFIRRFGAHKCYTVDLKDCKDSNDYLVKYGKEKLKETLENHIEIPLENVSSYNSVKRKVRDFFLNGMPKGIKTGTLRTFDNNFSVNTSHIILVTGIPSCFTKGQEIITRYGTKKISDLKEGDYVLSYNEENNRNEYNRVLNIMENSSTIEQIYRITMKDGTIIECTENHMFYTGESYVKIKDLLLSLNKFKNL